MEENQFAQLLESVFFAEVKQRQRQVIEQNTRFVHYTSAEVAMSIIQNRSVWMRNATTMNDFSEINHGLGCVIEAWASPEGEAFKVALENLHAGIVVQIKQMFDSWRTDLQANTYLTCLSEHPSEEDNLGRLSMWRAYGGRNGVALVLNRTPFEAPTDRLKAFSSPVFYEGCSGVKAQLARMAREIEAQRQPLAIFPADALTELIFTILRYGVLCTKHPAFKEEREWRVIYSPNLASSPIILPSVQTVRGVPQIVQQIPLRNDLANGLHGVAIPDLLYRLIIGPTGDPGAMRDAFVTLLREAGVPDPEERIVVTGIPLRQW